MRKKYESPTMMAGFRQNIALANESNVDLQCHNAKGRVNDNAGDSPNEMDQNFHVPIFQRRYHIAGHTSPMGNYSVVGCNASCWTTDSTTLATNNKHSLLAWDD
jgi:hypothetical protein